MVDPLLMKEDFPGERLQHVQMGGLLIILLLLIMGLFLYLAMISVLIAQVYSQTPHIISNLGPIIVLAGA